MAKGKILIIDDDVTLGKAIAESFNRAGFETLVETKGKNALSTVRVEKLKGIVVDCMIPGINGVELAKKIRDELNFQKEIVLISGIFKDKKFAQSSINKAAANDFLFKPLDMDKLISIFSSSQASDDIDDDDNWMAQLINKDAVNTVDKMEVPKLAILPILSALRAKKTSAIVTIKDLEIIYKNGIIVNASGPNKRKYVSEDLLKKQYTNQEMLQNYIDDDSDICKQVVEKSIISPHLLTDIQDTYFLRVINTLLFDNSDEFLSVSINEFMEEYFQSSLSLRNEIFIYLDYIKNIKTEALNKYFEILHKFDYVISSDLNTDKNLLSLPLFKNNLNLIEAISEATNVKEVTDVGDSTVLMQVVYLLQIKGYITFKEAQLSEIELFNLEKRLNITLNGIQGKTPEQVFKFLGVEDPRAIFVSTFFKSFAKINHPDKLPQTASSELVELNQQVFSIVSDAHGTLTDPEKKAAYLKKVKDKEVERMMTAESLKEKAQGLIGKTKFKEALELLKKARQLHDEPILTLYYYWCYLKVNRRIEDKKVRLEIYNELVGFEIEDKRNEIFCMVMGIFYKRSKRYEDAVEEFQKALGFNKNFLPARRELMNLKNQLESSQKSENILTGDIGTVVSGFFKKKAQ